MRGGRDFTCAVQLRICVEETPESQMNINNLFHAERPLLLNTMRFPRELRILVLAPHPDDFDERILRVNLETASRF